VQHRVGKEWCPDLECKTGFTLVQFQRPFDTADASDLRLPVNGAKIGLIHAFATRDPVNGIMIQHTSTSTGYVDLQWNLDCSPGTYFEVAMLGSRQTSGVVKLGKGAEVVFQRYWRLMCFAAIIRTTRFPFVSFFQGPSKWVEA